MSNIRELPSPAGNAKELLQAMMNAQDQIRSVVVLTINKDGSNYLQVDPEMKESEACHLLCFFQAYVMDRLFQVNNGGK